MRPFGLLVLVPVLVSMLVACSAEGRSTPPLRAASAAAAADVVTALLEAAKTGSATEVARHMCGAPADAASRATAALAGPLRIQSFQIAHVEPAWVGAEPYFRVEVTLHRASEIDPRSLSVRAREGCVDRLLGEPVVGAKRPDPTEISL